MKEEHSTLVEIDAGHERRALTFTADGERLVSGNDWEV